MTTFVAEHAPAFAPSVTPPSSPVHAPVPAALSSDAAPNDLLLRVLRGEPATRRPVWLMRQAGRYLPEYRALRERHSFEALSGSSELAAEVTLQPLARFGLDGAIIFADLMSPVGAMGVDVRFDPGPVVDRPVRTAADVDALVVPPADAIAPEVAGALRIVSRELAGRATLLGFAGAPWTLATYLVEGRGKPGFPTLRAMAARDEGLLRALLTKLTDLSIAYLGAQVRAGAQAVQLFDTWAGILSLNDWRRLVAPHLERLLRETRALGVPRILFVQDAAHLVDAYGALPSEALGVDWRQNLACLRGRLPDEKVLQGNIDPAVLLAGPEVTAHATRSLLARSPRGRHVVNLGHGLLPETPIASVHALVDAVHAEAPSHA
jgi:uroporphyrinogen decarboxylase